MPTSSVHNIPEGYRAEPEHLPTLRQLRWNHAPAWNRSPARASVFLAPIGRTLYFHRLALLLPRNDSAPLRDMIARVAQGDEISTRQLWLLLKSLPKRIYTLDRELTDVRRTNYPEEML